VTRNRLNLLISFDEISQKQAIALCDNGTNKKFIISDEGLSRPISDKHYRELIGLISNNSICIQYARFVTRYWTS